MSKDTGGALTSARGFFAGARVEEELRRNRKLLQTVFDALPVWVSVKAETAVTLWSLAKWLKTAKVQLRGW